MQTRYPFAFLLPFFLFLFSSSALLHGQRQILHDPSLNREDEEGFKEERERWLEGMHRAEPGVNVRVLNEETRRSKREVREAERKGRALLAGDPWVNITGTLGGYWSERGSNNQAGRTLAADIDHEGGRIYVAADGGQIWRGTLQGEGWTPLNDDNRFGGVRMLRVYRSDELFRIIAIYGAYAAYSDDDGASWHQAAGLDEIQRWGGFARAVMTDGPEPVIYAMGNEWNFEDPWGAVGVLYRSQDFGASFTPVRRFTPDPGMMDIWSPPGLDWAYMLHGDTLSRVAPDGTFTTLRTPVAIENGMRNVSQVNLRGSDAETLYLLARRGGTMEVHGSPDSGASWIRTGSTTSLFDRNSFAVSPSDPDFLVAGGIETMYSRDAGLTWDTVNQWGAYYARPADRLHADIPFIGFFTFPDNSEKILISTDGGLYRSDDGLATVRNLSLSGLGISQYYSVYTSRADTQYIFAGAQDQGFQRSEQDGGGILPFTQTISGDYGHITSGDGGRSLWTNYPGFSMYYPDALIQDLQWGRTFNFPTTGQMWLPPIVADPDTPNAAYLAGGGVNGGAHLVRLFHHVGTGDFEFEEYPFDFSRGEEGVQITSFAISPLASDVWYVATSNSGFFVSVDRGRTWRQTEDFEAPGGHYFYGANIVPSGTTPGLVYIAGAGYSTPPVWVSHDNGVTFAEMSEGLPPTLIYDMAASRDDRMLFAATQAGPYLYLADSGKWYDIAGSGAPDQTYWSVEYIDENGLARFGTYGRGIWDFRVAQIPSGVRGDPARSPDAPGLASRQLDETRTAFLLENPGTAEVTVRVYDLTGRVVAVLHRGTLSAGTHRFVWDGTASGGGPVPSGEYFCVAATSGTVAYAKAQVRR